jgi:hypothetical protein
VIPSVVLHQASYQAKTSGGCEEDDDEEIAWGVRLNPDARAMSGTAVLVASRYGNGSLILFVAGAVK